MQCMQCHMWHMAAVVAASATAGSSCSPAWCCVRLQAFLWLAGFCNRTVIATRIVTALLSQHGLQFWTLEIISVGHLIVSLHHKIEALVTQVVADMFCMTLFDFCGVWWWLNCQDQRFLTEFRHAFPLLRQLHMHSSLTLVLFPACCCCCLPHWSSQWNLHGSNHISNYGFLAASLPCRASHKTHIMLIIACSFCFVHFWQTAGAWI